MDQPKLEKTKTIGGEVVPKDAAAVILLKENTDKTNPEVYWVQRSHKLAFLGGFYAFPGGQLDATDTEASVLNCNDSQKAAMISCAARELFEELGVLVAKGAEVLTKGQRVSLLDDLESGRMSWPDLLKHYGLVLDADDYTFVGRWVTPPFSPRRFDTWFFLVNCPAKQNPEVKHDGELARGEWVNAAAGFQRWERSEVLAVPPILHALSTVAGGINANLVERFLATPHANAQPKRRIEFQTNLICFPVRTPTKPPATHTNCYLIHTNMQLVIVDPGSPYEEEQEALAACVSELLSVGRTVNQIVLTHVHPDHVAGVNALRNHLGNGVMVSAHELTAEGLKGSVRVDRLISDGDLIELEGVPQIKLRAIHTPGHARGHLCLHDKRTGTLLTGDNILGLGSVLIDPPEGNMRDYLNSLRRMGEVPGLNVLFGGHGPPMANPYAKINEYISHRLEREQRILDAVRSGASTASDIVRVVYTDVSPKAHGMAERAVLAHLEKLQADGLVREDSGKYSAAT
jgi:glyoxylase-like metal-dependent hydrolase (beta-lactamase superfamily II)/8-oxo-dGTP pyrophosphatase MutT (NUDIX family)